MQNGLKISARCEPGAPLWKRAPTRDNDGKPVSDFMMLIPKLRHKPMQFIQQTIREIELILHHYDDIVVFADLNLDLNILWVSLRPVPGMCMEIPSAIISRVPEARLVAERLEV